MVAFKCMGLYLLLIYLVSFTSATYDYSHGDYDYTYQDEGMMCYTCEYGKEDGESIGSEECGSKFDEEAIPKAVCKDTCIMDYTRSKVDPEKNFIIHRGCAKTCQEVNNGTRHTKCCKSNLCNRGGFHAVNSWAHCYSPLLWIYIFLLIGHTLLGSLYQI